MSNNYHPRSVNVAVIWLKFIFISFVRLNNNVIYLELRGCLLLMLSLAGFSKPVFLGNFLGNGGFMLIKIYFVNFFTPFPGTLVRSVVRMRKRCCYGREMVMEHSLFGNPKVPLGILAFRSGWWSVSFRFCLYFLSCCSHIRLSTGFIWLLFIFFKYFFLLAVVLIRFGRETLPEL